MDLHQINASLMAVSAASISLLNATTTLSGHTIKIAAAAFWGYKVSRAYHFTIRLGPHLIRDYCHEFMLKQTTIWTTAITLVSCIYIDIYSVKLLAEIPLTICVAYFLAFTINTLFLCRISRGSIFSIRFICSQPNMTEVDLFADAKSSNSPHETEKPSSYPQVAHT